MITKTISPPNAAPETTRDELVLLLRIDRLEQRSERIWTGGTGTEATFEEANLGWFATCGRIALALGESPCGWAVGDVLQITRRREG